MRIKYRFLKIIGSGILFLISSLSYADCVRDERSPLMNRSNTIPLDFNGISISSDYLQPIGTNLGSISVKAGMSSLNPEAVLWRCNITDLPNIYFLAATSGWDIFGGGYELNNGAYATWFRYVGLKQKIGKETLNGSWKKFKVESYSQNGRTIFIRVRDIPALEATLEKTQNLPTFSSGYRQCDTRMIYEGSYAKGNIFNSNLTGSCNTESAFIQLSGNNKVKFNFTHSKSGNKATRTEIGNLRNSRNLISYGLNNSNTKLLTKSTCSIKTKNSLVTLPSISESELKNEKSSTINFSIDVECDEKINSGINENQIAIGFLPSEKTQLQIDKLLLQNDKNKYLISENYNDKNTAKGVGVSIKHAKSDKRINFLKQGSPIGGGNEAGWYSIIEKDDAFSIVKSDYRLYRKEYIAELKKIPNLTVTPGKFKATATIVVKIQ